MSIIINIDPKWWWIPLGVLLFCIGAYLGSALETLAKNDFRKNK